MDGSLVAGSPGAFEAILVFFVVLGAIALGAHRFTSLLSSQPILLSLLLSLLSVQL